MNKKLKKMLAAASAMAMCAVSVVSMGAGAALWIDTTERIFEDCADFGYPDVFRSAIDDNTYGYCKKGATRDEYYTSFSEFIPYFNVYSDLNEEKANELSEFLSENYPSFIYECENHGETYSIVIDYPEEFYEEEQIQVAADIYINLDIRCGAIVLSSSTYVTGLKMLLPEPTLAGDANEDGKVSIADAVLIMQVLSNPDEFQLTPQGIANADIYGDGDGITVMDALTIQEMEINI